MSKTGRKTKPEYDDMWLLQKDPTWEEICTLISTAARAAGVSTDPAELLKAEAQFLKNIRDYCDKEYENISRKIQ